MNGAAPAVRPPSGPANGQFVQQGRPAMASPVQPQGSIHYENYPGNNQAAPVNPGYAPARPTYIPQAPAYNNAYAAPAPAPHYAPPAYSAPAGGGHAAPANNGGGNRNQGNRQGR